MELGRAFVVIEADQTKLTAGLNKAQKNVAASMKTIGRNMAIAGAAIVAGFGMAIKTAAQFEQSMAKTASVAGATSEELKELSDYARKMGEQSVFSASQAADGMYYLASAGMNVDEVMSALKGTLELAAATQADLAFTSETVAATLSQFGLDASEADRVANVFAATISMSQATMDKLSTSMSYVGPMAKSMGMSLEDTVGILGNLYNAGYDASMAGTALRMSFAQLIEPTTKGQKVLDRLTISVYDSTGKMRPFADIIDELAVKGLSTADAMALFGKRAGPAMLALVSQGEGAIKELTEAVTGTDKATEMAAMQIDTFQGAMKLLRSAFEELQITLVKDLMPNLKGLIEKITEGIKKVSEWMKANKPLVEILAKVTLGVGALMLVLGPLLMILPGLIAGITALSSAFIPFLVTGAIVFGIAKLTQYLNEMNKAVYETQIRLEKLNLAQIDVEIAKLSEEASKLQYELSKVEELPLSHKFVKDYRNAIENLNMKIGILIERREELTKAEEEGIDVTDERIKLDEEAKKLAEELRIALEKEKKAIETKTKSEEFSNAIKEIGNKIYKLTHTNMENAIKNLDLQKKAYLKVGISAKEVNKWYKLEIAELKRLYPLNKKLIQAKKDLTLAMKGVIKTIYELTHTDYEITLKNINDEYDILIKQVKAAKLGYEKEKRAIDKINQARTLEIKKLDESVSGTKELIAVKKTLADRIYKLTHTEMENHIRKLDEQKQAYIEAGYEIETINKWYDLEIAKLKETNKAVDEHTSKFLAVFEKLNIDIKTPIMSIVGYLTDNLANAIEGILTGASKIELTWKKFWEGLKNILIKALSAMIAKLIVIAAFSWLLRLLGVSPGLIAWIFRLSKGGGVGYEKGGKVKKFAPGGGTDTVPAMLTPGEYVISKPMVDFIKRSGTVTGNLIDAIKTGARTPVASFASGGGVSNPISNIVNINAGAIVINTSKFSSADAKNMFRLIEREAKMRGLAFGRV